LFTTLNHSQYSPGFRITAADPIGKVFLDEYPAFAGFPSGNVSGFGFASQHFGIHFQKVGGGFQIERLHLSVRVRLAWISHVDY